MPIRITRRVYGEFDDTKDWRRADDLKNLFLNLLNEGERMKLTGPLGIPISILRETQKFLIESVDERRGHPELISKQFEPIIRELYRLFQGKAREMALKSKLKDLNAQGYLKTSWSPAKKTCHYTAYDFEDRVAFRFDVACGTPGEGAIQALAMRPSYPIYLPETETPLRDERIDALLILRDKTISIIDLTGVKENLLKSIRRIIEEVGVEVW